MVGVPTENQKDLIKQWNGCLWELDTAVVQFNTLKMTEGKEGDLFIYWNNFISNIAVILCYLTRYFQDADWNLHLSSFSCSIEM